MHRLGAFAIIPDSHSRVLLCHRTDFDAWNLPGGGVAPGEAPWLAVRREVREEVGLDVTVIRLLGVYTVPQQGTVAFSFLCAATGGALRLSDEADDIGWFAPNALPETTLPRHRARIRDAFTAGEAPVLRTQPVDGAEPAPGPFPRNG